MCSQVARHTERRKTTERQALGLANGWTFTPFVMQTIRSWEAKAAGYCTLNLWAVEHGATKKDAAVDGLPRQKQFALPLVEQQPN